MNSVGVLLRHNGTRHRVLYRRHTRTIRRARPCDSGKFYLVRAKRGRGYPIIGTLFFRRRALRRPHRNTIRHLQLRSRRTNNHERRLVPKWTNIAILRVIPRRMNSPHLRTIKIRTITVRHRARLVHSLGTGVRPQHARGRKVNLCANRYDQTGLLPNTRHLQKNRSMTNRNRRRLPRTRLETGTAPRLSNLDREGALSFHRFLQLLFRGLRKAIAGTIRSPNYHTKTGALRHPENRMTWGHNLIDEGTTFTNNDLGLTTRTKILYPTSPRARVLSRHRLKGNTRCHRRIVTNVRLRRHPTIVLVTGGSVLRHANRNFLFRFRHLFIRTSATPFYWLAGASSSDESATYIGLVNFVRQFSFGASRNDTIVLSSIDDGDI